MPKIFISYRREDSKHAVGRLFAALRRHVRDPKRDLFIDIDNIPKGVDFVTHLDGQVAKTDILLAVIGPRWLDVRDPATNQRRLDNPGDFVRVEVAAALKRGIPVVPVMLDDTQIPSLADLPDDLKPLARRNGERLRHESFDTDVGRLIAGLPKSADAPRKRVGTGILALVSILVLAGIGSAAWYFDPLNLQNLVGLQTAGPAGPAPATSSKGEPAGAPTTAAAQSQLGNVSTAVSSSSLSGPAAAPAATATPPPAKEAAASPHPPSAGSAPAATGGPVKPSPTAEKTSDVIRPSQKPSATNGAVAGAPPGTTSKTDVPAKSAASPTGAPAFAISGRGSAAQAANKPEVSGTASAGADDKVALTAPAQTAASIRKPGDIIRDKLEGGGEGPEMVVLPLQGFQMGATDAIGDADEHPQHHVKFSSAFAMGKYEVTVGEYNACVAAGICSPSESATYGARLPAFKVSYDDALTYTKWLSEQTKQVYRLPSEAEWEFAAWARSPNPLYPWGTNPNAGCSEANGAPIMIGVNPTEQVCDNAKNFWAVDGAGHKPNGFGLYDTLGNVQEWVKDCYAPYLTPSTESDGKAVEVCTSLNRVVRGGGWNSAREKLRVRNRSWLAPATKAYDIGFRVLRELEK